MIIKTNYHISGCEYKKDKIINPRCPECLRLWNEFLDKNNFHVCGWQGCDTKVNNKYGSLCDDHFDY